MLTDEGFGVHVVGELERLYCFPDNVDVVNGGVLGFNLLHIISETERLIVIDIIRNNGVPGTLYRIDNDDIPKRVKSKNSMHQLDFIETLTKGTALGDMPDTVIFGVEPEDTETYGIVLTPAIEKKISPVIDMVLEELGRLDISYTLKKGGV